MNEHDLLALFSRVALVTIVGHDALPKSHVRVATDISQAIASRHAQASEPQTAHLNIPPVALFSKEHALPTRRGRHYKAHSTASRSRRPRPPLHRHIFGGLASLVQGSTGACGDIRRKPSEWPTIDENATINPGIREASESTATI